MLLFLLASFGCCSEKKNTANTITLQRDSTTNITLTKEKGSILPPDSTTYAILPVIYAKPFLGDIQQITLTEQEIILIEYAIEKSVKLFNIKKGAILIDLSKHKRQYFPGITTSGDRIVWVRCISEDICKALKQSPMQVDWRTQYSGIRDGGHSIFSLKVNLSTQMTYDFIPTEVKLFKIPPTPLPPPSPS